MSPPSTTSTACSTPQPDLRPPPPSPSLSATDSTSDDNWEKVSTEEDLQSQIDSLHSAFQELTKKSESELSSAHHQIQLFEKQNELQSFTISQQSSDLESQQRVLTKSEYSNRQLKEDLANQKHLREKAEAQFAKTKEDHEAFKALYRSENTTLRDENATIRRQLSEEVDAFKALMAEFTQFQIDYSRETNSLKEAKDELAKQLGELATTLKESEEKSIATNNRLQKELDLYASATLDAKTENEKLKKECQEVKKTAENLEWQFKMDRTHYETQAKGYTTNNHELSDELEELKFTAWKEQGELREALKEKEQQSEELDKQREELNYHRTASSFLKGRIEAIELQNKEMETLLRFYRTQSELSRNEVSVDTTGSQHDLTWSESRNRRHQHIHVVPSPSPSSPDSFQGGTSLAPPPYKLTRTPSHVRMSSPDEYTSNRSHSSPSYNGLSSMFDHQPDQPSTYSPSQSPTNDNEILVLGYNSDGIQERRTIRIVPRSPSPSPSNVSY